MRRGYRRKDDGSLHRFFAWPQKTIVFFKPKQDNCVTDIKTSHNAQVLSLRKKLIFMRLFWYARQIYMYIYSVAKPVENHKGKLKENSQTTQSRILTKFTSHSVLLICR